MGNITPIIGGMGASMDDSSLGDETVQAGLEIGVINDKIGYRISLPGSEPLVMLFSVQEMYSIMSAQQGAIDILRRG